MNLAKTYDPKDYEANIYYIWEQSGAFKPKKRHSNKVFSLVMPPPNANGNLHLGHALGNALQDIPIRYHRMLGESALYLPGSDHAGFETWVVYEKRLAKIGKSRMDFNREELYKQIYAFVQENKQNFESQFRALGPSCDWSRYTFTLDDKVIKTTYETFQKMWSDKLIYRGERPVNYCTFHQTGFADIEVNYEDAITPLYYLKYGPFTLATTRPETKFGDTAVAVNSKDKRYKKWVGKNIKVEGVNGPFNVMVIADNMVDMKFGTGVVKITPAHDFNDWDVAQRHNLPVVKVIDQNGLMNERAGRFSGMTVLEARREVVKALKEKDLLVKVNKTYHNRVGKCYKCGTVIEPMLMEQWFVNMQRLAQPAIKALENKEIIFYPASKRRQLLEYFKNIRDWNISRQIAWGIPIPAFQNVDDKDDWIFDARVNSEIIEVKGKTYRRDPDVFDTWFSSSQWPYITTNFPDSKDFEDFYPLNLMETGGEILYQWVGRMIVLGLYITGKIPFKNVYIHGYVLAEDGTKMSKSLNNVIDPKVIIDEFGSDGLRIGVVMGRKAGINQTFSREKAKAGRNFANKLWNIARFVEEKANDNFKLSKSPAPVTIADHWILSKLQHSTEVITRSLDKYRYSDALDNVYHLIWDDVADWYIEASKSQHNIDMLGYVLDTVLKLAHPFAPFVTETIWQTLTWEKGLLITAPWPAPVGYDKPAAKHFEDIIRLVKEVRGITSKLQLVKPTLHQRNSKLISAQTELITNLAKLKGIEPGEPAENIRINDFSGQVWLAVKRDNLENYQNQLKDNQEATKRKLLQLKKRLDNKSYIAKAPAKLVNDSRRQLTEYEDKLNKINQELNAFASKI